MCRPRRMAANQGRGDSLGRHVGTRDNLGRLRDKSRDTSGTNLGTPGTTFGTTWG